MTELPVPGRRDGGKRIGSRLLLAASLACGIIGAFFAGAAIADWLCDILGLSRESVCLGVKVACIAAALPAGFYLVERLFLSRTSRDSDRQKIV